MKNQMSKVLYVLLAISVLLAACAPQSGNGGSSVGTQVAPQPVARPEAQDYVVPVTPSPDFRRDNPQVSAVLDTCSSAYAWGQEYAVKTCGGLDVQQLFQAGTMFGVGAVAYATNVTAISNSGLQTAGLVYSVSTAEVVGFIVVAAEAAAPVAIGVGLIALPIMSLAEITTQPDPMANPLVQNWIQNRQAPVAAVSTQYVTEQTAEAVQIAGQSASQPVISQMGGVYDWVDFSSIPIVTEDMTIAVDWLNVGPMLSTRHPESSRLINGMLARADSRSGERILRSNKPNGCTRNDMSHGTICLFAGVNPGTPAPQPSCPDCVQGYVIIQPVITRYTAFLAIEGSVRLTTEAMDSKVWMALGNGYYMLKQSMFWTCSWWLSDRVANGHGLAPEQYWLDAGTGWDRVYEVRARYGASWPLAQITLPSWNG